MDEVKWHYERLWGPVSRRAQFARDAMSVEVYKWNEHATDEGVALYATNGASAVCVGNELHRVEFFAGFRPELDEIAPALFLLATYPLTGHAIGNGDTVSFPEPLWAGVDMRTFLVAPPLEEIVPSLPLGDSSHVSFLQVVPISEAELELKKRHGAEWLLGELNDLGIATWDPWRRRLG